jgi:hypothetical protein
MFENGELIPGGIIFENQLGARSEELEVKAGRLSRSAEICLNLLGKGARHDQIKVTLPLAPHLLPALKLREACRHPTTPFGLRGTGGYGEQAVSWDKSVDRRLRGVGLSDALFFLRNIRVSTYQGV